MPYISSKSLIKKDSFSLDRIVQWRWLSIYSSYFDMGSFLHYYLSKIDTIREWTEYDNNLTKTYKYDNYKHTVQVYYCKDLSYYLTFISVRFAKIVAGGIW